MRLKGNKMFEKTLMNQFVKIAKMYATKDAIRCGAQKITYSALLNESVSLSNVLRDRYPNEDYVYLEYTQGIKMCIGMFAVLLSGKAYIPIDPSNPLSRIESIIDDTNAHVLLTNLNLSINERSLFKEKSVDIINPDSYSSLPVSADNVLSADTPKAIAYILFTSGSTGRPKGVIQSNENVLFFIDCYTRSLSITADDNLSLISNYTFDAAIMDIFGALLNGATLCIFDKSNDSVNFEQFISGNQITIFHSVPTLYRIFVKNVTDKSELNSVRIVILGGEIALSSDFQLYRNTFNDSCIFINGLGPTESTLALQFKATKDTFLPSSTIPVGQPVDGINIFLLSEDGTYDTNSSYGELVIQTEHVALGYINRYNESAEHFQDNWLNLGRCYFTGDYLRKTSDGLYEFCGRKDLQVKINGIRIELGEIESAITSLSSIENCVVIPRKQNEKPVLVAYYTEKKKTTHIEYSDIINYISNLVPQSMIPSHFVRIDAFPLTSTGKINRKELLDYDINSNYRPTVYSQSQLSESALYIMSIWKDLLGTDQFDMDTTFYEAGGDSLLTLEMYLDLSEKYQLDIDLVEFTKLDTIRKLVDIIEPSH